MNEAFRNALAGHGGGLVTHVALVDSGGGQVGARRPVSWTAPSGGLIRPTDDVVFDLESGDGVAGWQGWSAATGGTGYGGSPLTEVTFGNDGTYTLLAAETSIAVTDVQA